MKHKNKKQTVDEGKVFRSKIIEKLKEGGPSNVRSYLDQQSQIAADEAGIKAGKGANDERDAFRHAFISSKISHHYGTAAAFLSGHGVEIYREVKDRIGSGGEKGNPRNEWLADLDNNSVGRDINRANKGANGSERDLIKRTKDALDKGKLIINPYGNKKPTGSYSDSYKKIKDTVATKPKKSELTPEGKSFAEKFHKVDNKVEETLLKKSKDMTLEERDTLMKSPLYKDKTSPLFNTIQKKVSNSFKYQYPGKSRSSMFAKEVNPLPTKAKPLRDSLGNDINKKIGTTLTQAVDKIGEKPAVRTFQRSINKINRDSRTPGIAPDFTKQKLLKEDGVFGPKTKTRMQEVGVRYGVNPVINMFKSKLDKRF